MKVRECEYYSESIGNGTALDYWDEVTGYQEIEYYGSDEDLKNDLEIYAEEEEDEYCGVSSIIYIFTNIELYC